ncbi:AAA family ATPase [Ruania zhangjianzhongii]|uniref:AAA family ATPase n=1 Tax=Ruania zhangjianzhongii TaxID=2603206 RepID=UPI0011CA9502|nr:AAA family ATPase [Ruania zhangjianzhongii]
MADSLVLINGMPGSGKTTLAGPLAVDLGAQLLSKDGVKEALADMLVATTWAVPQLGAIAMDTTWALAGAASGTVVIESFWFRPRDLRFAEEGIRTAGARSVVEVWCDVPVELARTRYARRTRHAVHEDDRRLTLDWETWAEQAEPLALGPVMRVDTREPIDLHSLVRAVQAQLGRIDEAYP